MKMHQILSMGGVIALCGISLISIITNTIKGYYVGTILFTMLFINFYLLIIVLKIKFKKKESFDNRMGNKKTLL